MPHLNLKKLLDVIKQDPAFIADNDLTPNAEKNYGFGIYQTENPHEFIIKQIRVIGAGRDSNMYSPPRHKTIVRYRFEVDQNTLQLKLITQNNEEFFITIDPKTSNVKWVLESGDELSVAKETEIFAKDTFTKIAEIQSMDVTSEKSAVAESHSSVTHGYVPSGFGGCRDNAFDSKVQTAKSEESERSASPSAIRGFGGCSR